MMEEPDWEMLKDVLDDEDMASMKELSAKLHALLKEFEDEQGDTAEGTT